MGSWDRPGPRVKELGVPGVPVFEVRFADRSIVRSETRPEVIGENGESVRPPEPRHPRTIHHVGLGC